jgi:hypothetical protein
MEIIRKTEMVVETRRRIIVTQPEEAGEQIFCHECAELMITAEALAVLQNVSRREIYRTVETGALHFAETESGILFVCPNSSGEISMHQA